MRITGCLFFLYFGCMAQSMLLLPVKKDSTITFFNQLTKANYTETISFWGYQNSNGKIIIPHQYNIAEYFSNGLAFVSFIDSKKGKKVSGYINELGRFEIKLPDNFEQYHNDYLRYCKYDHKFSAEGLALVYNSKLRKYGYINQKGKIVLPCVYDVAGQFYEGLAYVYNFSNQVGWLNQNDVKSKNITSDVGGFINTKGDLEITFPNHIINLKNGCFYCSSIFRNGYASLFITENGMDCSDYPFDLGIINKEGEISIPSR